MGEKPFSRHGLLAHLKRETGRGAPSRIVKFSHEVSRESSYNPCNGLASLLTQDFRSFK